jgi:4-hydroxy-3-methylbut-2-enyl diphosphate reductase
MKKILLLRPRGFCAGVVRAIDIVNIALDAFGAPIYVRKEIVHNRHVVEELSARGAIFVDSCSEVPPGSRIIFSAHGVSPQVRQQARDLKLRVIDATCPLVTKVHLEAVRFAREGYTILLIGHRHHDEVIGTLGEAPGQMMLLSTEEEAEKVQVPDARRVAYLTQTTLSLDEAAGIIRTLRRRFPEILGPAAKDICYATENRQRAVKAIVTQCDLLLVVGSSNSSNSNRLVEVAGNTGLRAYLIENERAVDLRWLESMQTVAVTAGASAPEHLVQRVVSFLQEHDFNELEELEVIEEGVRFALPPELGGIQAKPAARLARL